MEVLKITVPAATNDDISNNSLCVATLPEEFQGALLIYEYYGSWNLTIGEKEMGFPMQTNRNRILYCKTLQILKIIQKR